jgi:hypothetical protein
MPKERWVSRGIVKMLIDELKDYKAAAEVVSGSSEVFAACASKIQIAIAALVAERSTENTLSLQQVLTDAEEEIKDHREWEEAIRSRLAREESQLAMIAPLLQSLAETAASREALDALVLGTKAKYFDQRG